MGVRLFTPRAATFGSPASREAPARGPLPEAAALLLSAAAIYLGLALASLQASPADPALHGADWVGPVGARVARLMADGFGMVAWAVPLQLALLATPLFRRRTVHITGLRISGDLVIAIIVSALVHVAHPQGTSFGGLRSGGNVGFLFGELLSALFSTLGSFLIGGTVVGLILIGRSEFSFIEWCEKITWALSELGHRTLRGISRLRQAWTQARALRREQADGESEPGPKIELRPSDEAIIAQLEADDGSWIPFEKTGKPPLALSRALREQLEGDLAPGLLEAEEPPAVAPQASEGVTETSSEPQEDAGAPIESAAETEASSDGPVQLKLKIIDTRQNSTVERSRGSRRKHARETFALPSTELLSEPAESVVKIDEKRVHELARRLVTTLSDYGVTGTVEEVHPGPTVTTYELSPEAGTKVSKVAGLCDDLALGLSRKVRIIAPIPGKARIGFEIPNDHRVAVNLRELIEDERFDKLAQTAPLPVVLGRNIVGAPCFADLASMPHVIVAGATGAGKSVGLNVMLSSLLFKRSPDELRMLMIDPKVVELAPFDGIPHMLLPVVTDMKQAAQALKWAVDEMERRYQAFATAGTKNITTYNQWVDKVQAGRIPAPEATEVQAMTADGALVTVPAAKDGSDGTPLPGRMPHVVIVVDEFADLMMQQGKEVETSVARLAQKARAAGMHVVLATQRPSVDVITGMIKANFPTRVAFRVAQKVDSRTILDEMGAELLLGKGDMLVKLNGSTDTHRVQCPFVSEEEVNGLTAYLRTQGVPQYCDQILKEEDSPDADEPEQQLDARYDEAVAIVAQTQRCSTSWLQRKMTIGYNRAAKIVDSMEANGVVGPANGSKDREVFVHPQ